MPIASTSAPLRPPPFAARAQTRMTTLWQHRALALSFGTAMVGAWGALGGWWLPRGPLTTVAALLTLVISLGVGVVTGFLARSRWLLITAPVTFAAGYELARLGTDGPLVDGVHLSTYGLVALITGRGVHGLLSVLPLLLGIAFGAGCARRLVAGSSSGHAGRSGRVVRRAVAIGIGLGLALLAIGLARPARTAPITDADGAVRPGSIAELTTVRLRGHEHALMIRGWDRANPLVLFLAGGPGGSELGAMRNHLSALEQHVTVVTWDQRGAGRSYAELEPVSTLTLDSMVADTLAVTDYLRSRFGQARIYLVGQSWGSTLGVLAVQAAPQKYRAYLGTGQMVSQVATDTIFYRDTIAWARQNGQAALVAQLEEAGAPPYASVMDYEPALSHEQEMYPYDHSSNSEGAGGFSENIFVEEYSLLDQTHLLAGFLDTFAALYPQLQELDFRRTATSFEIPVFFVQGAHEAPGRSGPFEQWYPKIEAPIKDVYRVARAGHRPLFEQPGEFVSYLVGTVLPMTASQRSGLARGLAQG